MVDMIALMTFKGQEGLIKSGEIFKAKNERRAEELHANKIAAYYEEAGVDIEELLKSLNSHAKLDEFAKEHNLTVPSKDEAKLDERKTALVEALENA